MLHQQQQETRACCCAPQTSTRASLSVTSSGVFRSACCCCQKLYPYTRTCSPCQLRDSTSDVLSVSSESCFHCSSMLQLAGFLFLRHDDFSQKNHAKSIIFCPSSDQQNPGRKLIASAKYQTATIGPGNDGVSHKAL